MIICTGSKVLEGINLFQPISTNDDKRLLFFKSRLHWELLQVNKNISKLNCHTIYAEVETCTSLRLEEDVCDDRLADIF